MEELDNSIYKVVLYIVVASIVYVIGTALQLKILKRTWKIKTVTWQTEIFHSIVLIIHFGSVRLYEVLVYVLPDYTPEMWICMLLNFIRSFGFSLITWNSLSISVQKYIIVIRCIHNKSKRHKVETFLLVVFLTFAILWSAATVLKSLPAVPIDSTLESCLTMVLTHNGMQDLQLNETRYFCKFNRNEGNDGGVFFIYFMTELYCIAQSVFKTLICFNVIEAFVYYKIFRYMNRKLDPAQNKTIAKSQTRQQQMYNMKRAKLNAQVTAMITAFESMGTMVILAIHLAMPSQVIGITLFSILHYIILPYTFLLNTAENKNRLVGLNWLNLLRDSILRIRISFPWATSNNVVPFEHVKYNVNNDICIISKNRQPPSMSHHPDELKLESNLHVPIKETPSSSKDSGETNHSPGQDIISSTNREVSSGLQKQFIVDRNKLLNDMLFYINDEKVYISLFLQLTHFERDNCDKKGTRDSDIAVEETVLEVLKQLLYKGLAESRASQRQDILRRLQTYLCEDELYNEQLEYLINVEEGFLSDE